METEIRLTRLAKCAGCGAKVGAGTLSRMLKGFETHSDPRLIVGYDKSDDASVFVVDADTALISTTDFFPPIVDDPYLYGRIAATNAISDVYAMGGEPKLALNVMCVPETMDQETVREILRGGYDTAYKAGVIITGGHTIHGAEPIYGLAVNGFVHPDRVWKNCGAEVGDKLILTKKLGVGVLTTAAKAGLAEEGTMALVYEQMATLNKAARDVLCRYPVHACTDVTGFALCGHGYEMAEGSGVTIRIDTGAVPVFAGAYAFAEMGLIPAGAYRNREYAGAGTRTEPGVTRATEDLMFDPQTSGGLLAAVPGDLAEACLAELRREIPDAAIVGTVTPYDGARVVLA